MVVEKRKITDLLCKMTKLVKWLMWSTNHKKTNINQKIT